MPDEQLAEVLEFARYVAWREREQWRLHGRAQLAQAYSDDEPEHSDVDVEPD